MPNWVTNTFILHEGDITPYLDENEVLDFNRVIPMPEILVNTIAGSRAGYQDPDTREERPFTPEEQAQLDELGYDNWYDWRVDHWGTKWPACQADRYVVFDTAWSPPIPIFEALARAGLVFEVHMVEESEGDIGSLHSEEVD